MRTITMAALRRPIGAVLYHTARVVRSQLHAVLGLAADAPKPVVERAYLALQLEASRNGQTELSLAAADLWGGRAAAPSEKKVLRRQENKLLSSIVSVDSTSVATMPPYVPSVLAPFAAWMRRLPDKWDTWLGHTYPSLIHKLLREGKLVEVGAPREPCTRDGISDAPCGPQAFDCFAEMKTEGERPTAAVYEMLMRGCVLHMTRVTAEAPQADSLTAHLFERVMALWAEMREMRLRVDRFTYIELLRACGKAGHIDAAFIIFDKMLTLPQFLPDERTFDSMYEMCNAMGDYERAFDVFREQRELRKSLFQPKFTPVAYTHLMQAAVEGGQLGRLPEVLHVMRGVGCKPTRTTCVRLLRAALEQGQLGVAGDVVRFAKLGGHTLDQPLLDEYAGMLENQQLAPATDDESVGGASPAQLTRRHLSGSDKLLPDVPGK